MMDVKGSVRAWMVESVLMTGGDDLRDDTSFLRARLIDSTGVLELIEFLESRFGIRVADDEMVPENLDSLEAVERYVRGKLAP